jgi:hypothetical protein
MTELLEDEIYENFARIVDYRVGRDLDNIVRRRFGLRVASRPPVYSTNDGRPWEALLASP